MRAIEIARMAGLSLRGRMGVVVFVKVWVVEGRETNGRGFGGGGLDIGISEGGCVRVKTEEVVLVVYQVEVEGDG